MKGLNVMVVVPAHDHGPMYFAYDLAQMMTFTTANLMGGKDAPIANLGLAFCTNTYIHSARQALANTVIENNADIVLWLDSDMRFPPDTLARLLERDEDIVGINYSGRSVPVDFVAIKTMVPAEKCITSPEATGLEEVEAIGFGAVLMRTSVLRTLHDPTGEKGPWFSFRWRPEIKSMVGEDVYFCEVVREAGHKIYVDHDLSKECAHIGTLEYEVPHALTSYEQADDGTYHLR